MPLYLQVVLAGLSVLYLSATLRISIPSLDGHSLPFILRILSSPSWLAPLVFMGYVGLGMMVMGRLSPVPFVAYSQWRQEISLWAGVAAAATSATIDLWLFWTAGRVFARSIPAERRRLGARKFHIFNLIFGSAVIAYVVFH